MKLSEIGIERLLRIASSLIVIGLTVEIISLLWFHPLSFALFAFLGVSLIGLGVLVYLLSWLFIGTRPVGNRDST